MEGSTVSPLPYQTFQVVNFQGCEHAFHQRPGMSNVAACPPHLPLLVILQLHLLSLFQWVTPSCLFMMPAPVHSCYTVLLCFSRYRAVRLKMFSSLSVIYYLCGNEQPCNTVWPVVNWVPRLLYWTYRQAVFMDPFSNGTPCLRDTVFYPGLPKWRQW